MSLNSSQQKRLQQVWQDYVAHGETFLNASQEFTQAELDQRRRDVIPEVASTLQRFLNGEMPLEEFKTANDGLNKRNRLWGFQAINGQMFFNVLTKNSMAGNRPGEFVALLKKSLPLPVSIDAASAVIRTFEGFTKELGQFSADRRGAPKVGSIPFFLSYFWQIQAAEEYPIYYTSMVNALGELDIWVPSGDVADDYAAFFELNGEMQRFLSQRVNRRLHLWDVEHAFWFYGQQQAEEGRPVAEAGGSKGVRVTKDAADELPDGYMPPVVSILPRLAANDEVLAGICRRSGRTIEKVFEERLAVLFRMLGYETRLLGQGQGRVPDGVAISHEYRYAIIYDAKVRQDAYTMGTDERAIREYIADQGERLRKQGMRNLYFMVISSAFTGDHDDAIRTLKMETNVNEVLLVEVRSLLAMLEGALRNPDVDLGPEGLQRMLASSGLLTESAVREFLEL